MSVELLAHAKLTVSLRVTGVRDDGFHLLDAEMVTLDLADRLEIDDGQGLVVVRDRTETPAADDDLVAAALCMAGRKASVRLHKAIPIGAGLGGGSADAAAVLRWAGLTDPIAASRLGADVPFCVVGGRARVRGIGEQVEPLEFQARTYTLLTPELHCSTPVVYRRWDEMGGPSGEHGNDLEPAAVDAYPELIRWRDELSERSGRRARLAGSGSTWFVEGAVPGRGHVIARTVPAY